MAKNLHSLQNAMKGARKKKELKAEAEAKKFKTDMKRSLLAWCSPYVELRRRVQIRLNKGEARNALARAALLNRLGEIRDRSSDNQRYRADGFNLMVSAIVLLNTAYLEQGKFRHPGCLARLSMLFFRIVS